MEIILEASRQVISEYNFYSKSEDDLNYDEICSCDCDDCSCDCDDCSCDCDNCGCDSEDGCYGNGYVPNDDCYMGA